MTQPDCPAVGVHSGIIGCDIKPLKAGQNLRRKGLVQLEEVDVGAGQAGLRA